MSSPRRSAVRWLWLGIGTLALALPMVPLPRWIGARDLGPPWSLHVAAWGIGLLVVVSMAVLVGRLMRDVRWRSWQLPRQSDWPLVLGMSATLVGLALFVMQAAFAGNPQLIDEMAQLFQARVFASGRLAAPPPALPEFFLFAQTWLTAAGWVTQFPPGHAALLAGAMLVGYPEVVNPVLGGLDLVLVFLLARALYGRTVALVSAVLWLASAWVLFMSATYMNHATATTFALAAWASTWVPRRLGARHAVLTGLCLAAAAATRPLDAVAAAVPVLVRLIRTRRVAVWAGLVAGALPVGLAWGFYNWRLFGAPWTMGYTVFQGAGVGLGFHVDPWGNLYTPLVALSNVVVAVRRLHIALYQWPIPAVLPLAVWALAARQWRLGDLVVGLGVVAGPALYFFYWHSGFYPGPRFYYIAAPFLVIGTARAICWLWRLARRAPHRAIAWDWSFATFTLVVLVWSTAALVPQRVREYRAELSSLKRHPERALHDAGIQQALVLVPESWGARVIVRLWTLGASPALVERAYHRIDTCDLALFGQRAAAEHWAAPDVVARLDRVLHETTVPAPPVSDWIDPTIRLRARSALPQDCVKELARDRRGLALLGPLAWRNSLSLDSGLVFARDWFEDDARLLEAYPGWDVWRYAPPPNDPTGAPVLERVRQGAVR